MLKDEVVLPGVPDCVESIQCLLEIALRFVPDYNARLKYHSIQSGIVGF